MSHTNGGSSHDGQRVVTAVRETEPANPFPLGTRAGIWWEAELLVKAYWRRFGQWLRKAP